MIRRINEQFVPAITNMLTPLNHSDDAEGRLFRSLCRSRVQPQGTCVLNSGGQVLAWVLMYDKDRSVLDFLDHTLKRFRDHPEATEAIAAERYMRFPSARLEDFKEAAGVAPFPEKHPTGQACPGSVEPRAGTLVARVFGRALDKDGKPAANAVKQEQFALDRFEVSPAVQEAIAGAIVDGKADRIALPGEFARLCTAHAFLGNKDAGPMSKVSVFAVRSDLRQCQFWARRVDAATPTLFRIEGKTEVIGNGERGDFRLHHEVKLDWQGFVELDGKRIKRLLLSARGAEKLQWGSEGLKKQAQLQDEVAFLPSGRPIDMACGVRYGIIGEPVAVGRTKTK